MAGNWEIRDNSKTVGQFQVDLVSRCLFFKVLIPLSWVSSNGWARVMIHIFFSRMHCYHSVHVLSDHVITMSQSKAICDSFDFQNKEVIFCDQTSTEPGDQNSPACQAFCDVSIVKKGRSATAHYSKVLSTKSSFSWNLHLLILVLIWKLGWICLFWVTALEMYNWEWNVSHVCASLMDV